MKKLLANIQLLPFYAVLTYTMGLPGFTKLFDHERVIGKYTQMFQHTFVDAFPGTSFMIYIFGVLEIAVAFLLFVSLIKKEFLPHRPKTWLNLAIFVSLVTFASLGFGLRLIENHEGAANQYYYFMLTFFAYFLVQKIESSKRET